MGENNQKKALYIDSSSENARVVLIVGDNVVKSIEWSISFKAGKEVLEQVNELLRENDIELCDIDRVATHVGPARKSSALRAGVTVAAFLSYASDAELVAISGSNEGEIVSKVFSATPESVVKPNYDKPGFEGVKEKV